MNANATDITVIQDKSSSMWRLRNETIQGFNAFVDEQKKVPGKCVMSLTQFDTGFYPMFAGVDIQNVKPLNEDTYRPNGWTALLDAIGKAIIATGQRLEAMSEAQRPGRVVFVITTDGEENSSGEFGGEKGHAKIMEMIKHQTERYNWQFLFLGAKQDAIKTGMGLGVMAANTMSVGDTGAAVREAYAATSANLRAFRISGQVVALNYSDSQRKEQRKHGANLDALNK